MYPSREEFTELIYYISELKHQYTSKIDEQSTKINEQSIVIEELLWQIRELSDKIRQLNTWKSNVEVVINESREKFDEILKSCVCRYENHIPNVRMMNNSHQGGAIRQVQKQQNTKNNVKTSDKINKCAETDDDVYETIEFSDSSHIYTEPVKSDYGVLRKLDTKPSSSKQITKRSTVRTNSSVKMKKSARARDLLKYPAMDNVSKVDSDEDGEEENVELRPKSTRRERARNTKRISKQSSALVSDVGVVFRARNLESFTRPRDASGILINFDCSKSSPQSAIHERTSL